MTAENELLIDEEDQLYTEYMNIYDRLLATRDLASWDDSLFYQTEELDLEIDLDLDVVVT
jgi:hypothetical protein